MPLCFDELASLADFVESISNVEGVINWEKRPLNEQPVSTDWIEKVLLFFVQGLFSPVHMYTCFHKYRKPTIDRFGYFVQKYGNLS